MKCPGSQNNKYMEIALPQNLANFLPYIHTVINSKLFLNWQKIPSDYRISEILKLNSQNFYAFATRNYPKLYPITLDIYDG